MVDPLPTSCSSTNKVRDTSWLQPDVSISWALGTPLRLVLRMFGTSVSCAFMMCTKFDLPERRQNELDNIDKLSKVRTRLSNIHLHFKGTVETSASGNLEGRPKPPNDGAGHRCGGHHLLRDVPLQIRLFSFGTIVGPAQLYVDRAVQREKSAKLMFAVFMTRAPCPRAFLQ
jgi:hypothetical protein